MESDTPNQQNELLNRIVADMAIESWRFGKLFERVLAKLDIKDQPRYLSQYRWFLKKVDGSLADVGLFMVQVEGEKFDPGIAATPLNLGDFSADDTLVIDQMIEPIIMGKEGVVRMGTVTLKRVSP